MYHHTELTCILFERLPFPAEACRYLIAADSSIAQNPALETRMTAMTDEFMSSTENDFGQYLQRLTDEADDYGYHPYTLHFLFALRCLPALYERYRQRDDLTETMFWQHADDLRCKLNECIECKGIYGSFVAGWFGGMFNLSRFALGRFQYVLKTYGAESFTTSCGYRVEQGAPLVEFHIPSSGVPLTDEIRLDSYRQAENFYRKYFPADQPVILQTATWIIYPGQREFLPPHSNLLHFMDDFEIPFYSEFAKFHDDWRLFGATAEKDPGEWYEDTSLRRAYKNRVLSGGLTGRGMGFIFMRDGENVTHMSNSVR